MFAAVGSFEKVNGEFDRASRGDILVAELDLVGNSRGGSNNRDHTYIPRTTIKSRLTGSVRIWRICLGDRAIAGIKVIQCRANRTSRPHPQPTAENCTVQIEW